MEIASNHASVMSPQVAALVWTTSQSSGPPTVSRRVVSTLHRRSGVTTRPRPLTICQTGILIAKKWLGPSLAADSLDSFYELSAITSSVAVGSGLMTSRGAIAARI